MDDEQTCLSGERAPNEILNSQLFFSPTNMAMPCDLFVISIESFFMHGEVLV